MLPLDHLISLHQLIVAHILTIPKCISLSLFCQHPVPKKPWWAFRLIEFLFSETQCEWRLLFSMLINPSLCIFIATNCGLS